MAGRKLSRESGNPREHRAACAWARITQSEATRVDYPGRPGGARREKCRAWRGPRGAKRGVRAVDRRWTVGAAGNAPPSVESNGLSERRPRWGRQRPTDPRQRVRTVQIKTANTARQ